MPVWHAATRAWRESGELVVVGILQEQHPERAALFARWQGFDWPLLWDPFNRTGSTAVPNVVAVDEHGIVRDLRPNPSTFAEDFLAVDFPAPTGAPAPPDVHACAFPAAHGAHGEHEPVDVETLEAHLAEAPDDAALAFRAGVARLLRSDGPDARPEDFQRALDHWTRALALDPNQYIWRRRIQQYGPRMDKPYPFYDWVAEARADLAARGLEDVPFTAALTPAERAWPRTGRSPVEDAAAEPDPNGRIERDEAGHVRVEMAVAFDTSRSASAASLHLAFRPDASRGVHWNHEAGPPLQLWVEAPEGWTVDAPLRVAEATPDPGGVTSSDPLRLAVDLTLPEGAREGVVRGYAVYAVCDDADGACRFLRQDWTASVRRPR